MLILTEFVENLLQGAEARGLGQDQVFAAAGLPSSLMDDPMITIPQFVTLIRTVTRLLDDEVAGLLSRRQRVGTFAIVAAYSSQAASIGEAFGRCANFLDLLDNSLAISFRSTGREAEFRVGTRPGMVVVNELAFEMVLVLVHRLMGWLAGIQVPINRVELGYAQPDHVAAYGHLFVKAPFSFDAGTSCIYLPKTFLTRPVMRNEEQAMSWARRTPLDAFLPDEAITGLALEVATAVEEYMEAHSEVPSASQVAARFGIEPHTLRRQLQQEGVDFRGVRNQVRRDRATRLLNTTNQSVERVAALTGFSEASAFIRAFRSWTGVTPRHYRSGDFQ